MSQEDGRRSRQREHDNGLPVRGTVFVIDQDAKSLATTSQLLRRLPVDVVAFSTAEDFLRDAKLRPPACVVTALDLAGMSGLELLERLRDEAIALPAIVVTAHGDVATAVQAVRLGAVDFIEKPFPSRVLMRSVEQALQASATGRPLDSHRPRDGSRG